MTKDDQKIVLDKVVSKLTANLELEKYRSFEEFVMKQEATLPFEE
jgi:hypothetical protein